MISETNILYRSNQNALFPDANYQRFLRGLNLSYSTYGNYLVVGNIPNLSKGWVLHISVVLWQVDDLLDLLIPHLVKRNLTFRMPIDREKARLALNGQLGLRDLGKILSVFTSEQDKIAEIAKTLIDITH